MSYEVDIPERVRTLMGDPRAGGPGYSGITGVSYSWSAGYERLSAYQGGRQVFEYRGVYHPEGVCEGGGVCKWCGRTL